MLRVAFGQSIKPAQHLTVASLRQLSISVNLKCEKNTGDPGEPVETKKKTASFSSKIKSTAEINSLATLVPSKGLKVGQKNHRDDQQHKQSKQKIKKRINDVVESSSVDSVTVKNNFNGVIENLEEKTITKESKSLKKHKKQKKNEARKKSESEVVSILSKDNTEQKAILKSQSTSSAVVVEGATTTSELESDDLAGLFSRITLQKATKMKDTPQSDKSDEKNVFTDRLNRFNPDLRVELKSIMASLFEGESIANKMVESRLQDPAIQARLNEISKIIEQDPGSMISNSEMSLLLSHLVDEELEEISGRDNLKKETEIFMNRMIEHSAAWDESQTKDIFAVPPHKPFFPDYESMKEDITPIEVGAEALPNVPRNGFEIQMLNEDEQWTFPVDNQTDHKEDRYDFSHHVFLGRHLDDFPQVEPVRKYMELVITGLQQNPYLSYDRKISKILWYKKYFANFPEDALE